MTYSAEYIDRFKTPIETQPTYNTYGEIFNIDVYNATKPRESVFFFECVLYNSVKDLYVPITFACNIHTIVKRFMFKKEDYFIFQLNSKKDYYQIMDDIALMEETVVWYTKAEQDRLAEADSAVIQEMYHFINPQKVRIYNIVSKPKYQWDTILA